MNIADDREMIYLAAAIMIAGELSSDGGRMDLLNPKTYVELAIELSDTLDTKIEDLGYAVRARR